VAACTVFVTYDYVTQRQRLVRDVTILADIVGTNSTAALTFRDATAAAETLRVTAVNDHITSARLFTRDGSLLSTYMRPGDAGSRRESRTRATSFGTNRTSSRLASNQRCGLQQPAGSSHSECLPSE